MKQMFLLLALLTLGGCVADQGVNVESSVGAKRGPVPTDDYDNPRQVCEQTSEGGQSKTICY